MTNSVEDHRRFARNKHGVAIAEHAHAVKIRKAAKAVGKEPHQYLNDLDPIHRNRAPWPADKGVESDEQN